MCCGGPGSSSGPADFRIVEEPLVDSAIDLRFGDFEKTVEYVIVRAAPADADERARRDFEDRYASSSPVGSNGKVDAQMDAIGFGPWQAELERLMDHLLEEDRAEARDRLGRARRYTASSGAPPASVGSRPWC